MYRITGLNMLWDLIEAEASGRRQVTNTFYLYKGEGEFEKLNLLVLPISQIANICASGKLYYEQKEK